MAASDHKHCVTGTQKRTGGLMWCFTCTRPTKEDHRGSVRPPVKR